MSAQTIPRTQRDRAVNIGSSATAADGSVPVTLFNWNADDDDSVSLTLYVQCTEFTIPDAAIGTADFRPMCHVEWGNGNASNQTDIEVTARQRMPLAGSMIYVQAFIGSFPLALADGSIVQAKVPTGARATFKAFIGWETDASPLYPTMWLTQINQQQNVLVAGQARLASFRAFASAAASATAGFLMLFDKATAPVANDVPVDAFPFEPQPAAGAAPAGAAGLPIGQTRAFVHGIAWGLSSTPFLYTPIAAARAFVTAEIVT